MSKNYTDEWHRSVLRADTEMVEVLESMGFEKMTPVQAVCIPLILKDKKDVAAEAVTGSGKTLAFAIPLISWFRKQTPIELKNQMIYQLIISPTRELSKQIEKSLKVLLNKLKMTKVEIGLFVGGTKIEDDISRFHKRGFHILVSTPGRLEELIKRDSSDFPICKALKSVEFLVLDEADRLLDLGFEESINFILSILPRQRRTCLFSATQTSDIDRLRKVGLRNPACVAVKQNVELSKKSESRVPESLENYFVPVEFDQKFNMLMEVLRSLAQGKCIVFFGTCHCVNYFGCVMERLLPDRQIFRMHKKVRKRRTGVFDMFSQATGNSILICTDLMSRGVDIPDVEYVIQFDLPTRLNAFIHRCGRTARMGKTGRALTFLMPNEMAFVRFAEKSQRVPMAEMKVSLESADDFTPKIIALAKEEREFHESGRAAFVSFIQSYCSHECSLLLRIKELDIGLLAQGYGLLELPQMKEVDLRKVKNFTKPEVDIGAIEFKDPVREKRRLAQIKLEKKIEDVKGIKSEPFSKRKSRILKKKLRRLKKDKKMNPGGI